MFSKDHYINTISLLLSTLIGFLFTYKYATIYSDFPVIISLLFLIIYISIFILIDKINFSKKFHINQKLFTWLWVVLIAAVFIVITFVPRIGEIGRYPAIVDWLDRLFAGKFPYNSPHTPSAFPFLFFFSFPFYAIGNAGYLELIGVIIFAALALYYSNSAKENLIKYLMIISTPVFYYFVFVRCELFTNMMLITGIIILMERYADPLKKNFKYFLFAVLSGLALSTRSVAAIIFIIFFLYYFRSSIPNLILFGIIVLLVFTSLLLPFYFWDTQSFLSNGPFAIQSYLSYLPMWFVLLLLLLCVYIGWMIADIQEVFFACGVLLFIPVFVSMLIKIFQFGFYNAMINDLFDLSYYEFSLPFFILSIKEYKVDRFLGKVYPAG